ncbi:MAG: hypothetical protein MJZ24_04030 [Paludibacteraceae bacterium]|nr:hypothetical protein [Paludibacteraceae bacterium]
MKNKKKLAAAGLFCSALFCQCSVEDYALEDLQTDSLQIHTGIAAPIGNSTITMADLIKKQGIEGLGTDESGLLVFTYDTTTYINIDNCELEDLNIDAKIEPASIILVESEISSVSKQLIGNKIMLKAGAHLRCPFQIPLGIESKEDSIQARIDSVVFDKAKLNIQVGCNMGNLIENTKLTLLLSGATKNGELFSVGMNSPKQVIDLDGVKVSSNGKDAIDCILILKLQKDVELTLNDESMISISGTSKNSPLTFKTIWGILNTDKTQSENTRIDIDLFDDLDFDLDLKVVDPKVTIKANSNIGLPMVLTIESLKSTSAEGKVLDATFKNNKTSYSVTTDFNKKIGNRKDILNETFDHNNGRIDEIVNSKPKAIDLRYSFASKQTPVDSKENYFFSNDSEIALDLAVEIPAYFKKGSYITVNDTIKDVNLNDYVEKSFNLEKMKLKGEFINKLPFNAFVKLQFYQKDTINKRMVLIEKGLDRIIELKSATVDAETNKVVKASTNDIVIEYTDKDMDGLKLVSGILLTYSIKVDDKNEAVKVMDKDAISAKISAYVKGDLLINQIDD